MTARTPWAKLILARDNCTRGNLDNAAEDAAQQILEHTRDILFGKDGDKRKCLAIGRQTQNACGVCSCPAPGQYEFTLALDCAEGNIGELGFMLRVLSDGSAICRKKWKAANFRVARSDEEPFFPIFGNGSQDVFKANMEALGEEIFKAFYIIAATSPASENNRTRRFGVPDS